MQLYHILTIFTNKAIKVYKLFTFRCGVISNFDLWVTGDSRIARTIDKSQFILQNSKKRGLFRVLLNLLNYFLLSSR